jgi:predicted alpha/beta superfamily hydrolase
MVNAAAPKFYATRRLQGPSIDGVVFEHKIHSQELDRDVRVLVRQPDGFDPNMEYGAIYGNDAHNRIDQSQTSFGNPEWQCDEAQARAVAEGRAKPTYQVWIDSEHTRFNDLIPFESQYGGKAQKTVDFIEKELFPAMAESHNVKNVRDYRSYCGSSLDGLFGTMVAIASPHLFAKVWGASLSAQIEDKKLGDEAMARAILQGPRFDANQTSTLMLTFGTQEGKDHNGVVDQIGQRQLVDKNGAVIPEQDIGKTEAVGLQSADQVPNSSDGKSDALNRFLTVAAAANSKGHPDDLVYVLEGHEHNEASWRNQFVPMVGWLTADMPPSPKS